jgi:hypothetical protein
MIDDLPHDSDGDALRRLVASGSDLSRELEIDFAMDVPDQDMGLAFATAASALGFRTSVEKNNGTNRWTCYCSRVMVPSYGAVVATQRDLGDVGTPYKARPDGWGSFGNAKLGAS